MTAATGGAAGATTVGAAGLRNGLPGTVAGRRGVAGKGAGVGASCADAVAAKNNARDAVRSRAVSPKAGENLNFESTELVTKTLT